VPDCNNEITSENPANLILSAVSTDYSSTVYPLTVSTVLLNFWEALLSPKRRNFYSAKLSIALLLNYSPFTSAIFWFSSQFKSHAVQHSAKHFPAFSLTFYCPSVVWLDKAWNVCRPSNKDVGEVADIAWRNMRGSLCALQLSIPTTCT